jgi:hypothetical protein
MGEVSKLSTYIIAPDEGKTAEKKNRRDIGWARGKGLSLGWGLCFFTPSPDFRRGRCILALARGGARALGLF